MGLRRPSLLTLQVADLRRSLAFWHERLGLPVKLRSRGVAELQTDSVVVMLVEAPAAGPSPPDPRAALAWEVDDLEAARAGLAARGVACRDVEAPPGADPAAYGRRVAFEDPDGHRLELVSWAPGP